MDTKTAPTAARRRDAGRNMVPEDAAVEAWPWGEHRIPLLGPPGVACVDAPGTARTHRG